MSSYPNSTFSSLIFAVLPCSLMHVTRKINYQDMLVQMSQKMGCFSLHYGHTPTYHDGGENTFIL